MDLEKLAASAAVVANEYDAAQSAIADKRGAEAALLSAVLERVRPALRALSSPIKASERTWWVDNVSTTTKHTWRENGNGRVRGLRVAGDGPERDHPAANTGSYEGGALYLLEDGSFVEIGYEGTWSRWQGAASGWESSSVYLSGLDHVVRNYEVDRIVEAIAEALERQKGSRQKVTVAARERAAHVQAVATLLAAK